MDKTSNTIFETYTSRFAELDARRQLHFASRLVQWYGDPIAQQLLETVTHNTKPASEAEVKQTLSILLALHPDESFLINNYTSRKPYFEKYPPLFGIHQALFQLLNWQLYYDIDARQLLFESGIDRPSLQALISTLVQDTAALLTLSTYAINTLYLVNRLYETDERAIITTSTVTRAHQLMSAVSDELLVYFVTHIIIADSLFYSRQIPSDKLDDYRSMLSYVETVIAQNNARLTIDMQLELIVASKLCGATPASQQQFLANAAAHFDPTAGYITDPTKPEKNGLIGAEHRNVLYIMASRQTAPQPA